MSLMLVACLPALIQCTDIWNDESGLSLLQNKVKKLSHLDQGPNSCRELTQCELNLRNVTVNTLRAGGRGEIRYSGVFAGIDLVITASSTYLPKRLIFNGVWGYMGILNMYIARYAYFFFRFYKSGTLVPVTLKSVYITYHDIDGDIGIGRQGIQERVTLSPNYESYALHRHSLLKAVVPKNGWAHFTSTQKLVPNLGDPHKATTLQKQVSVQVLYKNVYRFSVLWNIFGRKTGESRSFFFSGAAALSDTCDSVVCPATQDCSLTFDKVVQNNLGGAGPDHGIPELRYGSVCTMNGENIDLVLTSASTYSANNPTKNGLSGVYGNINLLGGSKVDLKFQFVKSGTSMPVTLSSTSLTLFDLDGSVGVKEQVTASGYDFYTLGDNSTVTQAVLSTTPKIASFTSTELGDEADNPTDPMTLTAIQERRSVSLRYMNVNSFNLVLEISAPRGDGGRNFIFAGKSSLSQCP